MAYYQAAVALAAIATTAKQGEDQKLAAKRTLQAQERAQQQATSAAIRQDRLNEQDVAKANRRKPDLLGLMSAEQSKTSTGSGSTLLSGPLGVSQPSLKLGRTGLLGSP